MICILVVLHVLVCGLMIFKGVARILLRGVLKIDLQ